ncbi:MULTISPECIES: ABC transporter substrate-binding protein [unclassified Chelatococcus]|uniref:ABC transporter substrate-binding protein n=1 Tax=unclassified Chelatococcus TaxID=2638111 RepID=UPI001BD0C7DE|nr:MULTISPECIES: ABC transporter substrate-binding protein [unclassified Chelatococcus]MBS7700476.1 ABC transporter substrate-binding protein [Chelatococcus sp. YT9]MBX3556272.1 ABC transporter substrate-binding protein [Chelatococcus sp.]
MAEYNWSALAMDRRRFVTGTLTASATLMAPRFADAQQPTTLVGVLEEDPPGFNSAITSTISTFATSSPVHQGLTLIMADGTIEPLLAKSWEISPDGLTYTFHLRDDVMWHDGHPFTSADVKFSIENANGKLHPWGKVAYKPLKAIETPDDHTVIYRLSAPSASLMSATDRAVGAIIPKHLWEGKNIATDPLNQKPVGTGPYKLVAYERGKEVRYERNPNYFIKGAPLVDQLIFRIMPDPATRISALQQGEVDMIYWNALPQSEVARLSRLPNLQITKSPNRGAAYQAVYNLKNQYLGNKDVRKAFAHAIDRKFIRESVDGGLTSSEQLGPVSPASPLYNKALKDYAFDPALANKLLDQAGFPRGADGNRFTIEIAWPSFNVAAGKIADIIKQNLAAVGVGVKLFSADRAAMIQRCYVGGQFDIAIEAHAIGPDPDIGTERFYNSRNIQPLPYVNNSSYVNAEVDKLFDEQRSLIDLDKRKVVYDKIQEIIWDDLPIMALYQVVFNNVSRKQYAVDIFEDNGNGTWESFDRAKIVGVHTKA